MENREIINEFITHRKLRNKSYKNHKSSVNSYFRYLDSNGSDYSHIKIAEAQKYQQYLSTLTTADGSLKYSSVSVLTNIGRITTFYDYLQKKGEVMINPFREIEKVKKARTLPKNILNEKQMNTLLTYLKNFNEEKNLTQRRRLYRAHVLCELLYSTGARINEIAKLKITDIDTFRGTVRLKDSKTKKTREAFLNGYAEKVLSIYVQKMREQMLKNKHPEGTDLLFGAPSTLGVWLNTILKELSEKIELPFITSHCFRHSFGFQLLKSGCDMRYIQEMLGHSELRTTQIYTKVEKEDLKNVIDTYHPRKLRAS
jgi:integrase/recombinase XerD